VGIVTIPSLDGFTSGITIRGFVGATDSRKLNTNGNFELPDSDVFDEYLDRSIYTYAGAFVYEIVLQHKVVKSVLERRTSGRLFPTPADVST
jgi:hypothetical protein